MSSYDPTPESIKFAGEITLRKIEFTTPSGYKLDVRDQVIAIQVYEDIFSPFITMTITLRESLDFINALPLLGEEVVDVDLGTPTFNTNLNSIQGKFYVYKLADREMLGERNSVYTLYCVSYEALTDLNVKISRAFKGNVAEIATSLFGKDGLNTKKKFNVEPSKNSTMYVSNFWSPIKNLNYIADTAINKNDSATYLFFENKEGFNFVTLDILYKQDPYQKFTQNDYVRDTDKSGTGSTRNINKEYEKIIELKVRTHFDTIKNMNSGAYASRLYSYDMLRKKYYVKDYYAYKDFPDTEHLNNFSLYSSAMPATPLNFIYNDVRHSSAFSGFNDTSNIETKQSRVSAIQLLKSNVVEITVNGRTDYTVGMKVYVEVFKPAPIRDTDTPTMDDESGTLDTTLSANYLITAINNLITRENHTCVLELSKDSFVE